MSQTTQCLEVHVPYLKLYESGIWVCLLCASKNEMAQDARTKLTKAKLCGGWTGHRVFVDGTWRDH